HSTATRRRSWPTWFGWARSDETSLELSESLRNRAAGVVERSNCSASCKKEHAVVVARARDRRGARRRTRRSASAPPLLRAFAPARGEHPADQTVNTV